MVEYQPVALKVRVRFPSPIIFYKKLMFFYVFFILGLLASVGFILSNNSVKAVLFLILISISLAGLCFVGGADFLGCLFIVIYVGSVTVLMLFVIMMINVKDITSLKENSFSSFSFVMAFFLVFIFQSFDFSMYIVEPLKLDLWQAYYLDSSNLNLFNAALFTTFYSFGLISVGLLLFIAMVGSIFLTVQDYSNFKTQKIYKQIAQSDSLFVTYNK